ncbi:hypothetical protein BR63_07740 [Thermanaerosceptrum fracticalcis]|uniref:Transcriptional regulator n=1 Tax=Thermanaerosceptrum fracticalcis TaxID=1712410 RepID=A0A7G6E2A9_THEFR|nr:hypothetical protein [Thermanaerosceptrum fracticalcis]QNB46213.1 hypothetical protein BR63_07740 [Thermanaerosceptrum fracticalcis]
MVFHVNYEHVDNIFVSKNICKQLAVLRAKNLVVGAKEGTRVAYSVKDPLVFQVLDGARRIFDNHLVDTLTSWTEIKKNLGSR